MMIVEHPSFSLEIFNVRGWNAPQSARAQNARIREYSKTRKRNGWKKGRRHRVKFNHLSGASRRSFEMRRRTLVGSLEVIHGLVNSRFHLHPGALAGGFQLFQSLVGHFALPLQFRHLLIELRVVRLAELPDLYLEGADLLVEGVEILRHFGLISLALLLGCNGLGIIRLTCPSRNGAVNGPQQQRHNCNAYESIHWSRPFLHEISRHALCSKFSRRERANPFTALHARRCPIPAEPANVNPF